MGVSRTEFFLAKAFVLACIGLSQLIIGLVIAFIPATILNGFGTMPDGFIPEILLITIFPSIILPPCLAFHCCLLFSMLASSYLAVFYWLFCQLDLTFYANAHIPKYQNFTIFIIAIYLCYDC